MPCGKRSAFGSCTRSPRSGTPTSRQPRRPGSVSTRGRLSSRRPGSSPPLHSVLLVAQDGVQAFDGCAHVGLPAGRLHGSFVLDTLVDSEFPSLPGAVLRAHFVVERFENRARWAVDPGIGEDVAALSLEPPVQTRCCFTG